MGIVGTIIGVCGLSILLMWIGFQFIMSDSSQIAQGVGAGFMGGGGVAAVAGTVGTVLIIRNRIRS